MAARPAYRSIPGWSLVLFFFALFPLPGPARAGEDRKPVAPAARQTVVTAVPLVEENRVDELGSAVTTVSRDQIRDLNAQDLPSALRRVPGIVISRHNPVGSFGGGEGGTLFVRGHGASRPGAEISILVDGIPKFVGVWTHPLMDVLSVDVVESAEIYKAPQPVRFGNMAFAAIDLRTKRPPAEGSVGRVGVAGGSYRSFAGVAEYGARAGNVGWYLVASHRRSRGHRDDADGRTGAVFARAEAEFSEGWTADLTLLGTDNSANDPGSTDPDVPSQGRFATRDLTAILGLSHRGGAAEGRVKLYLDHGEIDWTDQDETPGRDTLTDYDNYGVRVRETARPWEGGTLMAGLDLDAIGGKVVLRDPEGPDDEFPRETFRISAPYLALSQQVPIGEEGFLSPSAGVRFLAHGEFAIEWAPQAGLVAGWGDTEVHAYYARGVNYPGVYVKVQNDVLLPGENGWRDLRAETLDHLEWGVSRCFGDSLVADLAFFRGEGRDRIVVSPPPPFPPAQRNIGEYEIRGVEGTLTWAPSPEIRLFAGATGLDADPEDLPYTPKWSFSGGGNWRFADGFQLSVDALYVDGHAVLSRTRVEETANPETVGAYFLLNARLSHRFTPVGGGPEVEVWIAGENLTDTDYEMKPGYPMPGANAMVGFDLEL